MSRVEKLSANVFHDDFEFFSFMVKKLSRNDPRNWSEWYVEFPMTFSIRCSLNHTFLTFSFLWSFYEIKSYLPINATYVANFLMYVTFARSLLSSSVDDSNKEMLISKNIYNGRYVFQTTPKSIKMWQIVHGVNNKDVGKYLPRYNALKKPIHNCNKKLAKQHKVYVNFFLFF